jgi:hypothetical protein
MDFRILVIADNCSDATAANAAAAGATVIERQDANLRGKGYALNYAFERSRRDGWAEAVVVVDADSEASANLLSSIAARIGNGAHAVQVHYGVLNPNAAWRTRLMSIALGSFHIVRSRARERLRLSCGIRGNGWCVTHDLLARVPYDAYSLTEDIEYGVALGLQGERVHYADEGHVYGEMVTNSRSAASQRQRWEQGRFKLIRQHALALFRAAAGQSSRVCLDLGFDLLVLPLSYIALNIVALAVLAASVRFRGCPLAAMAMGGRSVCRVRRVLRATRLVGEWRGLARLTGSSVGAGIHRLENLLGGRRQPRHGMAAHGAGTPVIGDGRSRAFARMFGSAVVMQALLSATNLIVGLILIRRTPDDQYGYYVLILTAILLVTTLQNAFIQSHMVVRMTGASDQGRADLVGGLFRDQRRMWPVVAAVASVTILVCELAHVIDYRVVWVALAATAAVLVSLFREFFRMVLLAMRRPEDVLKADAIYAVLLIAGAVGATFTPAPAAVAAAVRWRRPRSSAA